MLSDSYIDNPDEDDDEVVLDGFMSDDGKHQVIWQEAEIAPNLEYEVWWCTTHDRLYYGGCAK